MNILIKGYPRDYNEVEAITQAIAEVGLLQSPYSSQNQTITDVQEHMKGQRLTVEFTDDDGIWVTLNNEDPLPFVWNEDDGWHVHTS